MKKRRKRTKKSPVILKQQVFLYALFVGIWVFFGFVCYHVLAIQTKPVVETSQSSMEQLPPRIKRQLAASPSASLRVPILLYHYVEHVKDPRDTTRVSLNTPPEIFDAQIKTLVDDGFTFMSARELADVIDGKAQLPQKPILLTIDDGHWDVYTDILPILQKYRVRATVYVIPGFTGDQDFMSEAQVRRVLQSGMVEIGAHTVHHVALKGILAPIVTYEVRESKRMIEKTYGIRVFSFAYPNGVFDEQAAKIVKDAGFRNAVSTVPGIEQSQANRFFHYRIRPGRRIGDELLRYLEQSTFQAYQ